MLSPESQTIPGQKPKKPICLNVTTIHIFLKPCFLLPKSQHFQCAMILDEPCRMRPGVHLVFSAWLQSDWVATPQVKGGSPWGANAWPQDDAQARPAHSSGLTLSILASQQN